MGKDKTTVVVPEVVEELPRTIVRRVVKEKLTQISGDDGGADISLHKEALIAFSESARIFIHYLAATAHDICNESKRQIINAEDVLNALEEIEYSEFVEPLRAALDEFKKKVAGKRASTAKAKEENKKAKTEDETTAAKEVNKVTETEETKTENGQDEGEEQNREDEGEEENRQDEGEEDNEDDGVEDEEEASEDNDASNE